MLGGCRGILHATRALGWEHLEKPVRLSLRRKVALLLGYGLASIESLLRRRASARVGVDTVETIQRAPATSCRNRGLPSSCQQ
jgi:hypothetical protein